ncbi:MAG TPA: phosphatase PAP2 family protein [Tepidisphaeraceae bacterium]|jgi:membrane-associated phospholipid phosphatase|nr:phosphatase PAP2 family protein [Tepidisphaeraceae bacterium]
MADVDGDCQHVCYRRRAYWVVGWLALIALATTLDRWAASLGEGISYPLKDSLLAQIAKMPGQFYFTLTVAAVVLFIHPWKWRAGGLICLSVAVGGLIYTILKWCVGRRRPTLNIPFEFSPFIGGWRGLFVAEHNLSFPSGHATCAFATAAALSVLYPRGRWFFYAVAAITGLERVAERAHYLSDVVAAAGVGIISVHISIYLADKFINKPQELVVIREEVVQAEPVRRAPTE